MPRIFTSSRLMLPVSVTPLWPVIACDQFTSDPSYWERVNAQVGEAPSALRLVLPEIYLEEDLESQDARIASIHTTMQKYLTDGTLHSLDDGYVYVERQLQSGAVRRGLVGVIDLEAYDATADSCACVRPTERTVPERIPPRMRVRQNAKLEMTHVLLFADDPTDTILGCLESRKPSLPCLYDMDLMENGGHITGYAVTGEAKKAVDTILDSYEDTRRSQTSAAPLLYAVGDGNHSLATAKACYEACKAHSSAETQRIARYAMVEVINLRDASLQFEPIHRILTSTDPELLLSAMKKNICASHGYPLLWHSGKQSGTLYLDPSLGALPISILQSFLDTWLESHPGKIDYIHDEDALLALAEKPNSIGFLLPVIDKEHFFSAILQDGVFPRKTFSIGHAREKRYYMEARIIQA
ncbi:MAG: DUF1015 domain-containing protein [Clostridia bacterium]|nr:DUF1015 domain-containing protein [Clostridia bacterium]